MNIVLLHGFCEDHTIWEKMIPFSKYKDHITCIDLPGFGDNAANYKLGETVELMAEFVKKELEARNISVCILIGHSLGGYVTLAFAEKYPDMLAGFGLFHSTAMPDSAERKDARLKTIEFVKTNGAEAYHRVLMPGLFKTSVDSKIIEETIKSAKTAKSEGIIAALNAMRSREGRYSVYVNFTRPILFIAGESDTLIPMQSMIDQAANCNLSQIEILTNSAHMGQIEEPERSAEIIDAFVQLTMTIDN